MTEHIVQSYDTDLQALRSSLISMGSITSQMLKNATDALKNRDTDLALRVVATDDIVDSLNRISEEKAVLTIARRQPVANDLRALVSSIRIAADVERVGDLAKNIAKRTSLISPDTQLPESLLVGFDHMSRIVMAQFSKVIEAYSEGSAEYAEAVWKGDAEVDGLYTLIFRDSLIRMMEDPRNITFFTHILFCVKNLERIGDHATNIAETVYYIETGRVLEGQRPRMDNTNIDVNHPA